MDTYLFLGTAIAAFVFVVYLLFNRVSIKGGGNQFWDKWAGKTVWIWLPFYALQRLIREVIFKK